MGPQVAIDLGRIERNARRIVERCDESGIKVFGVTKGTCGMPQVARAMLRGGVAGLAESRFENIRRLQESGIDCPIMLLRSPPISRVEEVVRTVDISLQSELAIIGEISRIAERLGRVHDIIVMVDLGDLREGIWPNDLLPTVEKILDVTDADPPLAVGDRVSFRMGYAALLTTMTSEYVEKAPMHDIADAPGRKMVSVIANPTSAPILARHDIGSRLEAMNYDVVELADVMRPPAGLIRLHSGRDRRVAYQALAAAALSTHSLGLIWIDSIACLMPEAGDVADMAEFSVLSRALGLCGRQGALQPQLSPENIVLVGLREVHPAEAKILNDSRISAFTMSEIDGSGMRDVMRDAIRIASSGTRGFHVSFSPTATEMPGWAQGSGGMTVRETHQAMEAIALSGRMASIDVSPIGAEMDSHVSNETINIVMSAFGKRIL